MKMKRYLMIGLLGVWSATSAWVCLASPPTRNLALLQPIVGGYEPATDVGSLRPSTTGCYHFQYTLYTGATNDNNFCNPIGTQVVSWAPVTTEDGNVDFCLRAGRTYYWKGQGIANLAVDTTNNGGAGISLAQVQTVNCVIARTTGESVANGTAVFVNWAAGQGYTTPNTSLDGVPNTAMVPDGATECYIPNHHSEGRQPCS